MPTSATDLAALIELNVSEFLLQMGAAGGGEVRADDEVTWTVGGSPIGYHNAVVAFNARTVQRARQIVDDWDRALREQALPGSCHLTPRMQPIEVRQLLLNVGFVDGGEEPAMSADLSVIRDQPSTDLEIADARGAEDMRGYRDVLAAGFGEGPSEADWVTTVFTKIGFTSDWRHYVGYVAGIPVATASLLLTPPAGGIYFVSTHPQLRRRGYGAAITSHAMSEAGAAGASHAVLGSSPMGQHVYEQLGFSTVFDYRLLEREV